MSRYSSTSGRDNNSIYSSYRTGTSPIQASTQNISNREVHQRRIAALEKELAALKSAQQRQMTQSRLLTPVQRPASRAPVEDYMSARSSLLDQRGRLKLAAQDIYRNSNGSYNRTAVNKFMGEYDDTLPAKHRSYSVRRYEGIIEEENDKDRRNYGGYAKAWKSIKPVKLVKSTKVVKPVKRKVVKSKKPDTIRRRKPTLVR